MSNIDQDDMAVRLRRIETRLSKFMEWQGFDLQALKPSWKNGRVNIPSVGTPLREILNVIPSSWDKNEDIWVYHRGKFVLTFNVSEFTDEDEEEPKHVA